MMNMMLKPAIAASFIRFRRSADILEDRGRNGGGFELFLGGYAKCIAICKRPEDSWETSERIEQQRFRVCLVVRRRANCSI